MANKIVAVIVLILVGRMIYMHFTGGDPMPEGASEGYKNGRLLGKLTFLAIGVFALRTLLKKD